MILNHQRNTRSSHQPAPLASCFHRKSARGSWKKKNHVHGNVKKSHIQLFTFTSVCLGGSFLGRAPRICCSQQLWGFKATVLVYFSQGNIATVTVVNPAGYVSDNRSKHPKKWPSSAPLILLKIFSSWSLVCRLSHKWIFTAAKQPTTWRSWKVQH